jgi:GH15 family glucan-1,4-alpha-glucosidase
VSGRRQLTYLEHPRLRICSVWLVESLARARRLEVARRAVDKLLSQANHVRLCAEKIGSSGEALVIFPPTFARLSLITAAVRLDRTLKQVASSWHSLPLSVNFPAGK